MIASLFRPYRPADESNRTLTQGCALGYRISAFQAAVLKVAWLLLAVVVLTLGARIASAAEAPAAPETPAAESTSGIKTALTRGMTGPFRLPTAAVMLGLGLWLLLPRGTRGGRAIGSVLVATALGLLATRLPWVGAWPLQTVLWIVAGVTIAAGIGTVTMRNPAYCALWFAMSLLGTAALFLIVGAQFLAVATVVVYAGAIVVTFLFVLMLAQPEGQAYYDRLSWEPLTSAMAAAVMVFLLTLALDGGLKGPAHTALVAKTPSAEALADGVLVPQHVAAVGGQLFGRYLIAVEVAGILLLVALVGASAIVMTRRPAEGWSATDRAEERA